MTYPATFELSTTDNLTGLLNPAYFRHLLREELLTQAQANSEPLSLFLFDLDNFLEVNKTYGRQAGDEVLLAVTRTLQGSLSETAVICRYGGDEFCVALPDTRLDDAFSLVEEFRRQIAAIRLEAWPEVRITCSIGLAAFPGNGSTDTDLLREADQACYLAKSSGRNKVSLPLTDSRMITKTSHYTATQLERLGHLARTIKRNEASLLREGLDDLLKKYNDRLGLPLKQ